MEAMLLWSAQNCQSLVNAKAILWLFGKFFSFQIHNSGGSICVHEINNGDIDRILTEAINE